MEHLDGPFSLAALPYSQMNELLSRSGDRMYSRPNDPPPPPPPLMHPLGEIKPPSVIRWETLVRLPLGLQEEAEGMEGKVAVSCTISDLNRGSWGGG